MKPIKLVIKGLNSFIEEQTIDFNKLTDGGLFGIFGPTGSGKSTILDGMTLALYGDIARKSSNFINTNCNDLNVSYTFQISGSTNRIYVVNRQFRRDKKTGNAKTHAVSIKEITPEGEEILAESVTAVNKTCREILGLSLEDFTRTVVLPQGKFSEFLKLEGKQRREMLERLFNLQDYGERLAQKLSRQMNEEKEKNNQLIGELSVYEEISEDKLSAQKAQLEKVTVDLENLKSKQVEVEARFKSGEEVWNLQNELSEYKHREFILSNQSERMKAEEEKMRRGESAFNINPYLQSCEQKKEALANGKRESLALEIKLKELTTQKQQIEVDFKKAKIQKEEKLPHIRAKSQQMMELIEDNRKVNELENGVQESGKKEPGIEQIQIGLKKVKEYIGQYELKEKEYNTQLGKIMSIIEEAQKEEQALKVEQSIREQVNQGVNLMQSYDFEKKNYDKNINQKNRLEELRANYEASLEQVKIQFNEKDSALKEAITQQENFLKQVPISQEALLAKKEVLVSTKEKWERLECLNRELERYFNENKTYQIEVEKLQVQINEKKQVVEKLKETIETAKLEHLAYNLRTHLHEGMPCPVCGSKEHLLEDLNQDQEEVIAQLDQDQTLLKSLQKELERLEKSLTEVQTKQAANVVSIERLQKEKLPLIDRFKENNLEAQEKEFASYAEALQRFEDSKRLLEEHMTNLREERNKIEAESKEKQILVEENKKQLVALETEIKSQLDTLQALEIQLEQLKKIVGTEDFKARYEEIRIKDQQRERLLKIINDQNEAKQNVSNEKEKVQEKLNEYKARFEVGLTKFDAKQKSKQDFLLRMGCRIKEVLELKEEKDSSLQGELSELLAFLNTEPLLKAQLKGELRYESIVEKKEEEALTEITQEDLEAWYDKYPLIANALSVLQMKLERLGQAMTREILTIESEFTKIEEDKKVIDSTYESTSKNLLEVKTYTQGLENQLQEDLVKLDQKLKEENLTVEEVKCYLLTKEQIETLKQNISQYKEDCAKLMGAIGAVESKLGKRKLEVEQWNQLQQEKQAIASEVLEATKQHTNLITLVKSIEEALARLGKLREEKKKIDHKMAILTDLDKLFKGKRFVEFVAVTRLKYVSLEASKKLKEITNGNYGLEVDEDGKFIIRDYKNGGAQRDASTLSGGETFLASLVLALALSSEIQLKGTAPLELFFLDEGFGTLDDDLLEVVMNSLEKIHHDKLKVGIISHVESIKNRVPVKLLLTPAESGRGGTKIKLEKS